MPARTAARRVLSSARLSTWSSSRLSSRSANALTRRYATSEAGSHGAQKSSDTPWIIGSALIFGPAFLYLVSPLSSKSQDHEKDHDAPKKEKEMQPMKDDEGTEASGAELAKSVATAEKDDVSKSDNAPAPEEPQPVTDDEGNKVSGQEVSESVNKASETDVPKADKPAESSEAESQSSSSKSESKADEDEKPQGSAQAQKTEDGEVKGDYQGNKKGTFQDKGETGPTNMGKAREAAKSKTILKEAKEGQEAESEKKKLDSKKQE